VKAADKLTLERTQISTQGKGAPQADVALPAEPRKTPTGWKHARWYLFWLMPGCIALAMWGLLTFLAHTSGDSRGWMILLALYPVFLVMEAIGAASAAVGVLLFARFVARQQYVYWALPIILLALVILVWALHIFF